MFSSGPSTDNARLDVSEREQRHPHHTDAPVERHDDLVEKEVRDERDKPANEVPDRERDGRYPCLVTVRLGFPMMEGDEEVKELFFGGVERGVDLADRVVGYSIFGECTVDDGSCFGR